jgi:hypothetical protein
MKKLCLFLFAILFAFPVFSQLEKGYIRLKNGTVLKGKYQYSDGKIHIVSAGNLWTFDAAGVDTITGNRLDNMHRLEVSDVGSPWFYRMEAGLLIGNSQNNQSAPLVVSASANYRFTPRFSAGAGLGAEFYKESYLPVFLNLEYRFRENFASPFIFLRGGYEVPLEDGGAMYYDIYPMWSSIWPGPGYTQGKLNAKGGVMVNPGVGYTYMFSWNFGMSFSVGYQFHRLHYKAEEEKGYGLDIDYNRLSVKIGILFN